MNVNKVSVSKLRANAQLTGAYVVHLLTVITWVSRAQGFDEEEVIDQAVICARRAWNLALEYQARKEEESNEQAKASST